MEMLIALYGLGVLVMKLRVVCLVLALSAQFPAAHSEEIAAMGHVTVSKGRISVRADKVSLRQLLDEIRQAAGISLTAFPGAEAEEISATISDAPLEQGLRTILGGYDSMFLYSSKNSDRADLTKVWIYRKGQGNGLEPGSVEALAGTKSLREKLNDADPTVRARAFEALLNRPGIEEKEAVVRAVLAERDDNLRASMIESVRSSGLQLQPEFWGSLSADPSEHIRLLVLDALEGTSQIRDFATLGLTDPSPHVQLRAKEILDALRTATASAPPCDGCVKQP